MNYKLLGKSGLRASELALGTMTFGEEWGWGSNKEESKKVFDTYSQMQAEILLIPQIVTLKEHQKNMLVSLLHLTENIL